MAGRAREPRRMALDAKSRRPDAEAAGRWRLRSGGGNGALDPTLGASTGRWPRLHWTMKKACGSEGGRETGGKGSDRGGRRGAVGLNSDAFASCSRINLALAAAEGRSLQSRTAAAAGARAPSGEAGTGVPGVRGARTRQGPAGACRNAAGPATRRAGAQAARLEEAGPDGWTGTRTLGCLGPLTGGLGRSRGAGAGPGRASLHGCTTLAPAAAEPTNLADSPPSPGACRRASAPLRPSARRRGPDGAHAHQKTQETCTTQRANRARAHGAAIWLPRTPSHTPLLKALAAAGHPSR